MELIIIVLGSFGLLILISYIYQLSYFNGETFNNIKLRISQYVNQSNELNQYIESLKVYKINGKATNGSANYVDNSNYNFKRSGHKNYDDNIFNHNCSITVCKGAKEQPFKYLCKYFDLDVNEELRSNLGSILNKFISIEEGKNILIKEQNNILHTIENEIPFLIKNFYSKTLIKKLGFYSIDLSLAHLPTYTFNYVSAGGNSSLQTHITLDINNLVKFINYLSDTIEFKKSVLGQRSLMTNSLREKIKARDNHTCKRCGVSIFNERTLLEIDHIIPVSKEGETVELNLQTLCWKCNRSKGSTL